LAGASGFGNSVSFRFGRIQERCKDKPQSEMQAAHKNAGPSQFAMLTAEEVRPSDACKSGAHPYHKETVRQRVLPRESHHQGIKSRWKRKKDGGGGFHRAQKAERFRPAAPRHWRLILFETVLAGFAAVEWLGTGLTIQTKSP